MILLKDIALRRKFEVMLTIVKKHSTADWHFEIQDSNLIFLMVLGPNEGLVLFLFS